MKILRDPITVLEVGDSKELEIAMPPPIEFGQQCFGQFKVCAT